MLDTLLTLVSGIPISLLITVVSLFSAFLLSLLLTYVLTMTLPVISSITRLYILLFTGSPFLVQLFLLYYGSGQFSSLQSYAPFLWTLLSDPVTCGIIALALNSTAYTTLLFKGMVDAVDHAQWQACYALGMTKRQALRLILPMAIKRSLAAYSNEVVLIFKATSLMSTITIMDIMGHAQRLFSFTYDFSVFMLAGIIYLVINGLFILLMRYIERQAMAFERYA